jgi:hypothetical protein
MQQTEVSTSFWSKFDYIQGQYMHDQRFPNAQEGKLMDFLFPTTEIKLEQNYNQYYFRR